LCRAMDREDLIDDPRYGAPDKRTENVADFVSLLDEIFATRTMDEWAERFERHGLLWDRSRDFLEIANDPQVVANDYIIEINDAALGPTKLVAFPVQLEKSKGGIRAGAPEHGQHTEEVLLELGYSWDDVSTFKDQKVIL